MIRRKRRYDYGDIYTKPTTSQLEGTVGQAASPYYTPQNLNTLSLPETDRQSFFSSQRGQNLGTIANMAASALPQPKDNPQTGTEKQTEEIGVGVASALGPWWGALAKVGTTASNYVREDDNVSQAQGFVADTLNPFHQFNSLREGASREKVMSFLNPVGASHLAARRKKKVAQQKALEERIALFKNSDDILADYPVYGVGKYGMKFPAGGLLPYPTDGSDVNQLASNVAQYNGATHENGGIDLDVNNDYEPEIEIEDKEVIKDNMVLSNRLTPSKSIKQVAKQLGVISKKRETYATLAARLGKKKGKFEENLDSTIAGQRNTARIMSQRLDEATNALFMDQQLRKFNRDGLEKFPKGGKIPIYSKYDKNKVPNENLPIVKKNLELGLNTQYDILNGVIYPNEVGSMADSTVSASNNWLKRFDPNYKPKFPGGGRIPKYGLVKGPQYTKSNPQTSLEMNEQHAINNLHAALRFKNNIRGVNNNLVPSGYASEVLGGTPLQQSGGNMAAYTEVDPLALQRADSVIQATRPIFLERQKRGNSNLAVRKNGGYLPKYRSGNPIGGLTVKDPITGEFYQNDYSPNLIEPQLPAYQMPSPEPRNFDIGDYKGDIAALIGTIGNQIQIARMETEYRPTTVAAPRNSYTDRTGLLTNQINQQFRTASQGLSSSSSQDNQALKSNLYAKSLQGLNQALDSEYQRKDISDARHNELVNRTNIINSNIENQGKFISLENKNRKRALTQQNLDNFIRSYIGNEAMRDLKAVDQDRNIINASRSGDRGVFERYIGTLPEKTRRRLGYR
jgi:hypothetical protein